ncbi:MAG: hypothetical protein EOL97_11440 [Spirochaetia bacterium]|nr:hypothetical protein [Spirochaetia bacterium]
MAKEKRIIGTSSLGYPIYEADHSLLVDNFPDIQIALDSAGNEYMVDSDKDGKKIYHPIKKDQSIDWSKVFNNLK